MKPCLSFLVCFLFLQCLSSQPRQFIDSLQNDLLTVKDDSLRFRLLDELAWTYRRIDADSAIDYGLRSLEIAKAMDARFESISYSTLGVIKKENGLDDFGIAYLKKSLGINKERGNKNGIASNLTNLGSAYEYLGKYDTAILLTTQSIELKLELGNKRSAASTMSNLALIYEGIGNVEKAIQYLEEALEIVGPESRRARGIIHNLGLMYMKAGDYETSKAYYLKSIEGLIESENKSRFSSIYGNLGLVYLNTEEFDSALFYTLRAYQLKKEIGQEANLAHPAVTLAKIYLALNKYSQARTYGKVALEVSRENPSLDNQIEALSILAKIERKSENLRQSIVHYEEYVFLKDSLLSQSVLKAAEEAEAKFQTQIKEKENLLLKEEAQNRKQVVKSQRIIIISSIIILLLLIFILLLLRKQLRERKKLILKIEKQSSKLKELDQAKSRFFSNISHDLRSPLTLILGALDQINEKESSLLDKESQELLTIGYKNGKRLLYLADEIMDLTRLDEGKIKLELQQVKIVPYLRLLTKMFSSAADIKNVALEFRSDIQEESILPIDPHQFEKIIYNLLANAIKFTPTKGRIVTHLGFDQDQVSITISDSGSGIAPESLDHVFDRYYQSAKNKTESQEGVGIGLALVKELVDLHDGSISVVSNEKGTVFKILIPFTKVKDGVEGIIPSHSMEIITRNSLWMDLQNEEHKIQVSSLSSKNKAKTVLIIEDHKELRSYLKSILSNEFKVLLATNGSQALELLKKHNVDLILTDLMMPYMDGFELIDHLKEDKDLRKLPVLIVSARTDSTEKLNLLSKGVTDVIGKPFDKNELLLKIKNLLNDEWDSQVKLNTLYSNSSEEFEKDILSKLEKLILKRVDDPHLSVLDLADEMAASERKVYRMIKKLSGLTPYELIKEVRWQYLEEYLKKNKVKTASQAAGLIGMSNPSFFSEQYEKRFGKSLTETLDQE